MNRREFIVCGATLVATGCIELKACNLGLGKEPNDLMPPFFSLPDLSPHISLQANQIHYNEHFVPVSNYVLNEYPLVYDVRQYNSYFNHCHYWQGLSIEPSIPNNFVKEIIKESWGSFSRLYNAVKEKCFEVTGSGWLVVKAFDSREIVIDFIGNDDEKMRSNCLISIDIWEHAYYLDFRYDVEAYIDSIVNLINWEVVNQRAMAAQLT